MKFVAAYLFLLLSLAACGSAYIPAEIRSDDPNSPVTVVEMSFASIESANRQTNYQPRTLPAIFSQTGSGGGFSGTLGALPVNPIEQENRPGVLTLRLPPPYVSGAYRIGVGDVLVLATPTAGGSVEELTGLLAAQNRRQGYTVQDDGTITIPDVGRVVVGGLNVSDAEAAIFDGLVRSQIDPSFNIEIAEFNSQRISVGGAVGNPSVVPIRLGPLYLNEAIIASGGFRVEDRQFASIRLYRDGSIFQIPLTDFDRDTDIQRIQLKPDDSIFVDTEYRIDRAQAYFEQQIRLAELEASRRNSALSQLQTESNIRRSQLDEARGNFQARLELGAVDRDYVYVVGEVETQTRFALPFESQATLADALLNANGIAPSTGDPSQIYVLRATGPDSAPRLNAWRLDGSNAVNMLMATRFEMRPDDVIFVAEQPITSWNRLVQQIVPSLLISSVNAATN